MLFRSNADDDAFRNPTKPIGPFFTQEEAEELHRTNGWLMVEDSGRGWRYVVPSPKPRQILDLDLIISLVQQGIAVIAAGGGGIPMVLRADGSYGGVPAVIDKDLTSAVLGVEMGADTLEVGGGEGDVVEPPGVVELRLGAAHDDALARLAVAQQVHGRHAAGIEPDRKSTRLNSSH